MIRYLSCNGTEEIGNWKNFRRYLKTHLNERITILHIDGFFRIPTKFIDVKCVDVLKIVYPREDDYDEERN